MLRYPEPGRLMMEMGVLPGHRRHGVGKELFAGLLAIARREGATELIASVSTRNPDGVAFTDRSPKSELGRQIVVRFDDPRNLIIIEGYVDPAQPPVLTVEREFRVPTLHPHETELLRRIAEGNLQLGASAQAF